MRTSPLLTLAMRHIVNHPDQYDQEVWFCGTKACLAGRIALIAGACFVDNPVLGEMAECVEFDGSTHHPADLAERLAHLYQWEARWLWNAQRTMPELYREVNRLERGLAPTFWNPHDMAGNGGTWRDQDGRLLVAVHRGTVYKARSQHSTYTDYPDQSTALVVAQGLANRYGPLKFHPQTEKGHEKWLHAHPTGKSSTR